MPEFLEPRPGDVVLLDHGEGAGGVSSIIRCVTKSPYSHSIVALGDGRFTDAYEGAISVLQWRHDNDVEIWNDDGWGQVLGEHTSADLYRLETGHREPDPALLLAAAEQFVGRAGRREQDGLEFDTGALAGLALLRTLTLAPSAETADMARARRACFVVLNNGDGRLFCSEYAHRILTEAGARPPLPREPFLLLDEYPNDDPGIVPVSPEEWLRRWLRTVWPQLEKIVADLQHQLTGAFPEKLFEAGEIGAVVDRIIDEFRSPSPIAPYLERANFFVPADFIGPRRLVGRRTLASGGFAPI